MEYQFNEIEQKWQQYWKTNKTYKVTEDSSKPKFYVLDMFPYPSGAGLHVGHPLGYIASDIYTRYKRHNGFNVLHPMGYDAYGLPAEQYAIQTGQHPAVTTEENIKRYREQLDKIGFSFDWDREVRTCDPKYYKWTQWAFVQMFNHWFDNKTQKAEPIERLIAHFEQHGSKDIDATCTEITTFSAQEWNNYTKKQHDEILLNYRLAYLADTMVNWCPELGTVLANDEVKEGVSVRGGHPVFQKRMRQWSLRVSAYAERLLTGLELVDWSESLTEVQRNWIGKSVGAIVYFPMEKIDESFEIFTTRPDTIYGATFMVLAPEHELTQKLTTPDRKENIDSYIKRTLARTERERIADAKTVTGEFTGSYAINPLTGNKIPIWIADYVLSGYGTGAIMAVPAHDSRDFAFARKFDLPIIQVVVSPNDEPTDTNTWDDSYDAKEGKMINSGIINNLDVTEAIGKIIDHLVEKKIGSKKINYRLRDAIFSRQRYWGEPFPVFYKDGMPHVLNESQLPLELPAIDKYLPTEDGQPPLGRAKNWHTAENHPYELSTMPGFAGSSAYYIRYMDPHNTEALVSKSANNYWQDVDLYIGGTEHATGHLIYSRFWNKLLYDLGIVCKDEPFKKLINQGMIQGRSNFVYRQKGTNTFVSLGLIDQYETTPLHVDVNIVHNDFLDMDAFKAWRPEFADATFILEENRYRCGDAVEKMSKSMFNVVNPDVIIEQYGADTLRLYEMFLGPLEQSKPWDTKGIDGVSRFLKKLWRLFYEREQLAVNSDEPNETELKVLHRMLKKITEDIERFSFNTSISAFMICVNELSDLKCSKKSILEPLLIALNPFAPHITEELWEALGNKESIVDAQWPAYDEKHLVESTIEYPISFNGKLRFTLKIAANINPKEIEEIVLANENTKKYLQDSKPKKIIIVPKKIINIVI
ncbi:MAG: leucine--tRNA ligase [Salinivirgaceae bacterium]|nr:leucine--tRNA ligase [Salinivirgaceae bacterium]MDD4746324.1 leucine--tRNA ligase [Salinivirgaceae bacterium]MDY0279906.1 leucine--tRNA ligase [Salinivirgaceae bacterium]